VFEKRGDEAVVLAALRFLMLAEPGEDEYRERFDEIFEWSVSVREALDSKEERLSSAIGVLSKMVRLVPDREIVDVLVEMLIARYEMIVASYAEGISRSGRRLDPRQALIHGHILQSFPHEVIYYYFLCGDPVAAKPHLDRLASRGLVRMDYVEMLESFEKRRKLAESYYTLARYLSLEDTRAGMRACIMARAADHDDPRYPLCIGRALIELGRPESAVGFFLEAARISDEEDVYIEVIELVRLALAYIHMGEKTERAQRVSALADKLIAVALRDFADEDTDLRLVASSLLYTVGEVEFDNGEVESSITHLERSFQVSPNMPALVKLAEASHLIGADEEALRYLGRVDELKKSGRSLTSYWEAVAAERRGDSERALGRSDEAQGEYEKALDVWRSAELEVEEKATAEIRKGVLLFRLGRREEAMGAFREAIRADPNRRTTYAEIISFLVCAESFDAARLFYQLAFNQDRIAPMWKIYYSLWIEGLSRVSRHESYDLAHGYLARREGKSWQDRLARFFTGELPGAELRRSAENPGQVAEMDYYSGVLALADGRREEARRLFEAVIRSSLLGFFEYKMARVALAGLDEGEDPEPPSDSGKTQ
jgi:tetratricopeptide (TPR) repeat protein